jgi:hypothetical protein
MKCTVSRREATRYLHCNLGGFFFCGPGCFHLYEPDVVIYVWGSFLTASTEDRGLQIILHGHTVDQDVMPILA